MATLHSTLAHRVTVMSNGCMEFDGYRDKDGYGIVRISNKSQRAHRVSYALSIGPIPEGLLVLHRCDNPPCVNPDHLFVGTDNDNAQDKVTKGRGIIVEKNGHNKLTPDDVFKDQSRRSAVLRYSCRVRN